MGTDMIPDRHSLLLAAAALAAVTAAAWLLLFVGPMLLNAHRDDAVFVALLIYLGVPAGLAFGGAALARHLDYKD
jgi:hypothetical protein